MKVKIPKNLADVVAGKLMQTSDRIWKEYDRRWAPRRITASHYNVLRILNGAEEPISQIAISRRLLSSRANVTKLIDRLERQGLVKRLPGRDRRVKLIDITSSGRRFLAETIQEAVRFAEKILQPLSVREQRQLENLLKKLEQQ
jgi:MarR family 2-MHQ and catechol resistance regulon transcriptional repressor